MSTTPILNSTPNHVNSAAGVYRELRVTNILLAEMLTVLKQMLGPAIYNPTIMPDTVLDAENWRNDPSFGA